MSLVDDTRKIQRAVGADADGIFGPRTAAAVLRFLATADLIDAEVGSPPALLDERTADVIATLDRKAQDRAEQLALLGKATAATFGCDWVAISGHRSWEDQDALYAQGRTAPGNIVTNAKGGHSNHNFGIAIDFGVFRHGEYLDEANPALAAKVHAAVAIHAKPLGFEWGGSWKGLRDYPHFEISTGLTMAQKRNLYGLRGTVL